MFRWMTLVALAAVCLACSEDGGKKGGTGGSGGDGGGGGTDALRFGSIRLEILGLPDGLEPTVVLDAPNDREYVIRRTTEFDLSLPGAYSVRAPVALPQGTSFYVTEFRGTAFELEAGETKVVRIRYERLPYSVSIGGLILPWRGKAELTVRVEREPGFTDPLHLSIEKVHEAFDVEPASRMMESDEPSTTFVFENTGPLVSVEESFGYTLTVSDGRFAFEHRRQIHVQVLVTSAADAGKGTLREILELADEIPRPRRVYFAPWVRTIQIGSPLVFDSSDRLEILGPDYHSVFTQILPPDANFPPSVWILNEGQGRVFDVRGELVLSNFGMLHGRGGARGGCIHNEGDLRLGGGMWLYDCTADRGGAIANARGAQLEIEKSRLYGCAAEEGGAIFVEDEGSVRIVDSLVAWNHARLGAGLVNHGELELEGSDFAWNVASLGGAILNHGSLRDLGGRFTDNGASEACGAIADLSGSVWEGTIFRENEAREGGAICAIEGVELEVTGAEFQANRATLAGAILLDRSRLDLQGSRFTANLGGEAGGALVSLDSSLAILATFFSANEAGEGGALFAMGGDTRIVRSAFAENRAQAGGAIHAGRLHLENSTLAYNQSTGPGGALYLTAGLSDLRFNTLVENQAPQGGGIFSSINSLLLGANVVWQNSSDDIHLEHESEFYSDGFNHFGILAGTIQFDLDPNDRIGGDPGLEPVLDATLPFFAPQKDGPLVDALPPFYCEKLLSGTATDQRGIRRPRGEACDIGAIEMY